MRARALVAVLTIVGGIVAAPAGLAATVGIRACGAAWTTAPQPVAPGGTSELDAVDAASPTDAWAVGNAFSGTTRTLTRHFDGTTWTDVSAPAPGSSAASTFAGVAALAPDDAWAVGASIRPNNLVRTSIEHWDGTAWAIVPSPGAGQPAGGALSGVAAAAPDDIWAVGSFGQGAPGRTLIEHWDGTAWTVVTSPNKGPFSNALSSVAVVTPDDVWAVGTWFMKAFVDRTLVLHWDGTTWKRVPSPSVGKGENHLVSVDAVTNDDIWAVGSRGLHTLTEHWDGVAWSVVMSPTPGGNADLAGVAVVATDEVWAVGGRLDRHARALRTLVERWDGTRWRVVNSANKGSSDNHLWGVTATTGKAFAVGSFFRAAGNGPPAPLVLERCGP